MDDHSCLAGIISAIRDDCRTDVSIHARHADHCGSKGLVSCTESIITLYNLEYFHNRTGRTYSGIVLATTIFSPYQMARLQAMFSSGSENYMQLILQDFLSSSNFVGNNGMSIAEALPGFYSDYILTCLTSMYGILPAILLCCILAALVFGSFSTAIRQKNQLGMLMGCGSAWYFS